MIAECADKPVAVVSLLLDTRPPKLKVSAQALVEPPDAWSVTVVADEDIGGAAFSLVDSLGTVHGVGFERIDSRTLVVVVPTTGVASDNAVLTGWVADAACNRISVGRGVHVLRERSFDVELTLARSSSVQLTLDRAFEVDLDLERSFDVEVTLDALVQP